MTAIQRPTICTPADRDDVDVIRRAAELLCSAPGQVMELRVLNVPSRYRDFTVAGWFDDLEKLAQAAAQIERQRPPGVYVTLNPCNPALLCRGYNRIVEHPKATTADHDIIRRVWLPIDADPVRPAGISSSPEEIEAARERIIQVEAWLNAELRSEPAIRAFSGNGWHLLYRVDLPANDESTAFIKRVIDAAADKFSDQIVSIDRSVFNAARIWKLYGTMARKGDEVPRLGRVHRRARILHGGFDHDRHQTT